MIPCVRNLDKAQLGDFNDPYGLTKISYEITVRWQLVLEHAEWLFPPMWCLGRDRREAGWCFVLMALFNV